MGIRIDMHVWLGGHGDRHVEINAVTERGGSGSETN